MCLVPFFVAVNVLYSWRNTSPDVSIAISDVTFFEGAEDSYANRLVDMPNIRFRLNGDVSSLFHWNAKQLFIYVTMSYQTANYSNNEVVIWDKIILRSDKEKSFKDVVFKNKYRVADISVPLYNREVEFKVHWNVIPVVGLLPVTSSTQTQVYRFRPRVLQASEQPSPKPGSN